MDNVKNMIDTGMITNKWDLKAMCDHYNANYNIALEWYEMRGYS